MCPNCGSDEHVLFDVITMENEEGEYTVEYYVCKECEYEWEEVI